MSDLITQQDKIYQSYQDLRWSMVSMVSKKNIELTAKDKPKLFFSFIDPIPPDDMYGTSPGVILNGCKLLPKQHIFKKVFELPKSLYGIHYMPLKTWHKNIDKEFNCFINRNDAIRQTWFYLLYSRNLLDQGYVSYNAAVRLALTNNKNSMDYFDENHRTFLSSFDYIYDDIKKIIPYKSFDETGDLRDTILQTKFSIVIETYFERTDSITFSEKTYRVLQVPRPWLLFGSTGSVQYLRELGFYVYDDFVDHSYDLYDTTNNSVERQESMLKSAKALMDLKITDSMIDYWESKTQQNIEIMLDWRQSYKQDFEKVLADSFDYCNNC